MKSSLSMPRDGSLGLPAFGGKSPEDEPEFTPSRPKPSPWKGPAAQADATRQADTSAPSTAKEEAKEMTSAASTSSSTAVPRSSRATDAPALFDNIMDAIKGGLSQLYLVAGHTSWDEMFKEMLKWPILVHVAMTVAVIYSLGYLRISAVLVVPWMVVFLWMLWSLHLNHMSIAITAASRLDCILAGLSPEKESAWWLNKATQAAWPVFLNTFLSEKVLPKLAPWFLNKYKPAVLLSVDIKSAAMGHQPPVVSNVRVLPKAGGDNHLELEMDLEIASGDDMSIQTAARVLGMGGINWTAYVTSLHLTGKVRLGLKFSSRLPFVERVSVMFPLPPQVSLAIRVMGGFDAASMPVVASYVEATLQNAIRSSMCWPNRLLILDVVKAVTFLLDLKLDSDTTETSAATAPIPEEVGHKKGKKLVIDSFKGSVAAAASVEIIEADNLIAADSGGTSDPYVRGVLGPSRFTTEIIMKTLTPKWGECYDMPVVDWNNKDSYTLRLRLRDHDMLSSDDELGQCEVDLRELRGGQRHNLWVPLKDVPQGSVHIAVTITGDAGLTEEETEALLAKKKAEEAKRVRKIAALVGKLDPKAGEAAAALVKKMQDIDPKATTKQAVDAMTATYQKMAEGLIKKNLLPKALLHSEEALAAFVKLVVIEARDLIAADRGGTSDPYVKILLQGTPKITTKVINKTLDPTWLEEHTLALKEWPKEGKKCPLIFEVWDRDRLSHDDPLGTCSVDLAQLKDGKPHDLFLTLEGVPSGTLRVSVQVMDMDSVSMNFGDGPEGGQEISSSRFEKGLMGEEEKETVEALIRQRLEGDTSGVINIKEMNKELKRVDRDAALMPRVDRDAALLPGDTVLDGEVEDDYSGGIGVVCETTTPAPLCLMPLGEAASSGAVTDVTTYVKVEIIEAVDLFPVDSGTSDPFVKGSVGTARFITKHFSKSLNPKWNEAFKVPIVDIHEGRPLLVIEVFDKNTTGNIMMGQCRINLGRSLDGLRHEMLVRLEGAKTGKVRLAVTNLMEKVTLQSKILDVIPGVVVESWDLKTVLLSKPLLQESKTAGRMRK